MQSKTKSNPFSKISLFLSLFFSFYFSKSFYCCSNVASLTTHKPTNKILKLSLSFLPLFPLRWIGALIHTRFLSHIFYFNFTQIIPTNLRRCILLHHHQSLSSFSFSSFFKLLPLFHSFHHIILSVLLLLFDCM